MEVSYKRDLSSNYMILKGDDQCAQNYEVHMITENRIYGFLPCICQNREKSAEYFYEITGRQSMQLLFERQKLGYEQLRTILKELSLALEASAEYLLNMDHILLSPEFLYLSPDLKKLYLCYHPGYQKPIREAFLEWTEYLLSKLDKNDSRGIEFGYDLYQKSLESNFALSDILKEQTETKEKEIKKDPVIVQEEILPVKTDLPEKNVLWKNFFRKKSGKPKLEDYVAEAELTGSNEKIFLKAEEKEGLTGFLAKEQQEGLRLKSLNPDYPDMVVKGSDFLVGKKKQEVDGYIASPVISRIHARITCENQESGIYYIEDLNSTNGTWIDKKQLDPYSPVALTGGERLAFANIEYEVHL